jgi:NAD(P)-dependent dehydrogenase (short-subunit alcohol dehydrogenase family)
MNRIALITGGQQGIGLGIANALATAGYALALTSQADPTAPAVQAALRQLGPSAAMGPVTTFVSNAGVPAKLRGDMLDIAPDNFDFVMDINLRGAFFLAQEVARRMLSHGSEIYRSITVVTSVSATMASIERAEYCMSKAAASMMATLFAARLAPHGIGVFELRPGIIATEMTAGVKDKYTARIAAGLVPAARWGQPADIGNIIVPIAEGNMAFANGAVIPVDGGLSIARL